MSWMQKLYRTYESILEQGVIDDTEPLTPVGHTIQNAHIVIVIDGQGNFQTARVMPPKTAILLPDHRVFRKPNQRRSSASTCRQNPICRQGLR